MKRLMKTRWLLVCLTLIFLACTAEDCDTPRTSDQIQREQQERVLAEGTAQTGMPAIKNFRERKLLKDILELRDQEGFVTYTYLFSEFRACLVFLGSSFGYGIPYATQYTNPQKIERDTVHGYGILPQADPNGLFSPASAEGTWVMMKNPRGNNVGTVYTEPRIIVMPFPADDRILCPPPVTDGAPRMVDKKS